MPKSRADRVTAANVWKLENAALNKQWSRVLQLLEQHNFSHSQRSKAVHLFIHQAPLKKPYVCKYFRITPYCSEDQLDALLEKAVTANAWRELGKLLRNGQLSPEDCSWLIEEAKFHSYDNDFRQFMLSWCDSVNLVAVFPELVKGNMWSSVQCVMYGIVSRQLYQWIFSTNYFGENDDPVFWDIIHKCRIGAEQAVSLSKALEKVTDENIRNFCDRVPFDTELSELLYTTLRHVVVAALCSEGGDLGERPNSNPVFVPKIYKQINDCIKRIKCRFGDQADSCVKRWMSELCRLASSMNNPFETTPYDALRFFEGLKFYRKQRLDQSWGAILLNDPYETTPCDVRRFLEGLKFYVTQRLDQSWDAILLKILSIVPIVPTLQNVSLKIMLRQRRWDVISQACLSHVWEPVRQELFKAAVQQGQWKVVKQWADHSLCDEQRLWALQQAFREEQWEVCMLLADHGLTVTELMRWHYRLAEKASWKVVLKMLERGADVEEVKLSLQNKIRTMKKKSIRTGEQPADKELTARCQRLSNLEDKLRKLSQTSACKALKHRTWQVVLFKVMHSPCGEYVQPALQAAMESGAWHVVIQLVRLVLNSAQKDSLFPTMIIRQQWAVCRVLMESGVSTQLCLECIQTFMRARQWTLLARLVERDIGDELRRQVMQCALQWGEGSLVWQCMTTLEQPLSVEERRELFPQALRRSMWQAIKPLVAVRDPTGIQHRDISLLEAIEQHQWDVVDQCQWHHADINMKDRLGNLPIQTAATKEDWEAVEELVVRGGDPNKLDFYGVNATHRAVHAQQWDLVKLMIEYHSDIHLHAHGYIGFYQQEERTPLQMLIDMRQGEVINHTLMWCPDQCKGANTKGETTLHALCLDEPTNTMYYQIARGVDPLAVTNTGQSALMYAVANRHCPQKRVAECCRLGFSTHQPSLTRRPESLVEAIIQDVLMQPEAPPELITSPFLLAVVRGLPDVACMLYEAGSSSYSELFELFAELHELMDPDSADGSVLYQAGAWQRERYQQLVKNVLDFRPQLTEMATIPRRLVSSCRLLISHSLTVRGRRHRAVQRLPLTEKMKNYISFSDLEDPDYGKDVSWPRKC